MHVVREMRARHGPRSHEIALVWEELTRECMPTSAFVHFCLPSLQYHHLPANCQFLLVYHLTMRIISTIIDAWEHSCLESNINLRHQWFLQSFHTRIDSVLFRYHHFSITFCYSHTYVGTYTYIGHSISIQYEFMCMFYVLFLVANFAYK